MSIKTWEERYDPDGYIRGAARTKEAAMQAEINELRAVLQERDAEIERLKTVPMKYRRMAFNAQLQDEVAAQRKVLYQVKAVLLDVAESINLKRVWKDSDGQRMDEAVDAAITAIQEQLK